MPKYLKYIIQFAILNFFMISVFLIVATKKNAENKQIAESVKEPQTVAKIVQSDIPTTQEQTDLQPATEPDPFLELPKHNKSTDCWISYRNHIYDITTYFGSHPGGDALLAKYCGADGTKAFDSKDRQPPRPHSSNAENLLTNYLIY